MSQNPSNTAPITNPTEADERAYLDRVIQLVDRELAGYRKKVASRHGEARDLVLDLQENKATMDHVEKANARQSVDIATRVSEHGEAQQRRLERLAKIPFFGRIDITHDPGSQDAENPRDGDTHAVYIGVHSFNDDKNNRQLVHDWRAPVSSIFYEYELGEARFDSPAGAVDCEVRLKRQYRIEDRELKFMLDTALNIQDDILQEELSRTSDDTMKNIVATIQRDQNAIIRNEKAETLIIQGSAGSGKTSIALHRIAYLLYKFKDTIRSDDVLIVSPNQVFAHYISQVLPELGEEMIQETTMEALASFLLGAQVKFQGFSEQITTLLEGNDDGYAERVRFKAGSDFLKQLDSYIQHVRQTNHQPTDVSVGLYTIPADQLNESFNKHQRLNISKQLSKVSDDVVGFIEHRYGKKVVGKVRNDLRASLKNMLRQTTLRGLYKDFYDWLDRPEMFKTLRGGRYEYNDVFPLIYLQKLIEPIRVNTRIKHLVVDEMQDYTPVQYQVLSMLYPCRKTILGDHNQSVSPLSASSAEAISDILRDSQCVYMHKSYRSTLQITMLAQSIHENPNLTPIERHGPLPTLVACADDNAQVRHIQQEIEDFRKSTHNALGIICKTQDQANALYEAIGDHAADVHLLDAQSTTFSNGILIATAYLAKGLEFDRVLVPGCDAQTYHAEIDRHMLYVACTRAMHRLTLTHTAEPTPQLRSAIDRDLVEQANAAVA